MLDAPPVMDLESYAARGHLSEGLGTTVYSLSVVRAHVRERPGLSGCGSASGLGGPGRGRSGVLLVELYAQHQRLTMAITKAKTANKP